MLLQNLLLLIGISYVCAAKESIGEYLLQHSELTPITDQSTEWDRASLPADKNITYPVENHPVPEIRVRLWETGQKESERRPKKRERRQISPESCYLFFANRVHLVQLQNVPSLRINVALTGYSNAVAVDFDKREGYLFWSDVSQRKIYRSFTNGSELTILVDSDITTPDGIAWDWVNKKLYWTDVGDRDLEVLDVDTGCRKKIYQFDALSRPRAIVVDPNTGWLYWTDWGSPARIERASMDGNSRTLLHTTNLWWPNGLTLDYATERLYWVDAGTDRLESSNADGSDRILLSNVDIYHPFSVTFYQDQLFWTDWQLSAVVGAPVADLSAKSIIVGDLSLSPLGIAAACAERQEIIANPCDGHCSKLCLLSTRPQGYTCSCPDNCSSVGGGAVSGAVGAECEQSCGKNGQCTGRNQCTCNDGWRGVTCNQGLCVNSCIHGDCVGPDVCSCDAGWSGDRCTQAVCCSECGGASSCTAPDVCTCDAGWTGTNCDIKLPTASGQDCSVRGCLNGGSCKSTVCECPSGFGGTRCEKNCAIQEC